MSRNKVVEDHYRANYSRLVKRIRNRTRDFTLVLPEEIVQESYAKALKYFRTFNPANQVFDAWFSTILNNTTRDVQKEERNQGATDHADVEEVVEDVVVSDKGIIEHIGRMPECNMKTILVMYYLYGFKTKDIAEFINLGHSNVRISLVRWAKKMEEQYVLGLV